MKLWTQCIVTDGKQASAVLAGRNPRQRPFIVLDKQESECLAVIPVVDQLAVVLTVEDLMMDVGVIDSVKGGVWLIAQEVAVKVEVVSKIKYEVLVGTDGKP